MRDAVNFILGYIERHGDTQQSAKATQHRLLLAQEHEPSADATGDHGDPSPELTAAINHVVFGLGATSGIDAGFSGVTTEAEQRGTWDDEAQPSGQEAK